MRLPMQVAAFVVTALIVFCMGIISSPVIGFWADEVRLWWLLRSTSYLAQPTTSSAPSVSRATDFTISNFDYRFLRTSPSKIYDEYSFKVDIANRSDRAGTFFVTIKFYDAKGFAIEDGFEMQRIPAHSTQTVSSSTYVDYPQARDVKDADVEVQVQYE